jgi:hypothetical protein
VSARDAPNAHVAHCSGALLLALPALAFAAGASKSSIGGSYELDAQVVAAGGSTLGGANGLSAVVVLGQNNAAALSGANGYAASTGFWSVATQGGASDRIFHGSFESSGP